ncbi:unnamed protein product [Polarella glacialis]|uniref:Uncharacterized protein n=1 Tax=Polarella glacialis TaxID=89957 RepID=A0A813KVN9_POLGL|nr:unnamed protein product [Polarella glacialis]
MLHGYLMMQMAWGAMSPSMVHGIAKAAMTDIAAAKRGCELPKLAKLASVSEGKFLWRTLCTIMSKESSLPEALDVTMPYKGGNQKASVLLPHEYFADMHEDAKAWATSILPVSTKLPEFWESMQNHPAMQDHPIKERRGRKDICVALGLHGDEVPIAGAGKIWRRSSLAFSWFSILANAAARGTLDVMICIWGVFEKFVKEGTMQTFWSVMKWSFECLLRGKWPHSDWRGIQYDPTSPEGHKAGRDLAGGYCGMLIQFAGDLDYNCKWLGLPRWSAAVSCCALCKATLRGNCSWMDMRPAADWIQTILSPTICAGSTCPLFQVPGLGAVCVARDYMHCMFLGWLQYLYGSVFYMIVYQLIEEEPLENLHEIWDAEIMGLDQAMLVVWTKYMKATDAVHRRIRQLLDLNCTLASMLDEYSPRYGVMAVPEAVANKMQDNILMMGQLHVQLFEHFKTEGVQIFNLTSKTHFAIHSIVFARYIHPALVWC